MDFPVALKLALQTLQEYSKLKELQKKNHNRHFQILKDGDQILFPFAFHGSEPINLAVLNKNWKIHVLETDKTFLHQAVKRTEAIDLESRINFFDHGLEEHGDKGYAAGFSTLVINLLDDNQRALYLKGMVDRLLPGARLTVLALFNQPGALDAWKEEKPEAKKQIEELMQIAPPLDRQAFISEMEALGLAESYSWGTDHLLESIHFKKGV